MALCDATDLNLSHVTLAKDVLLIEMLIKGNLQHVAFCPFLSYTLKGTSAFFVFGRIILLNCLFHNAAICIVVERSRHFDTT